MAHGPIGSESAEGTRKPRLRFLSLWVVILLIGINAGYSVLNEWGRVKPLDRFAGQPWPQYGMETFASLSSRYQQLHKDLNGISKVGFICGFPGDNQGHRMMAQSMLAPTLVTTDAMPALVIASFKDDEDLDRWLANAQQESGPWVIRRTLGEGLALLEHARP